METACPRGMIERVFRTDHLSFNFILTLIIVKSDFSVDHSLQFQPAEKISTFLYLCAQAGRLLIVVSIKIKAMNLNNNFPHGEIQGISYCYY